MQKAITKSEITAVILAGGQATRMQGQDKGLITFNNKTLISYVVDAISNSVDSILVSANRNIDLYQEYGKVITDELDNFQGPLAGIAAALNSITTKYLLILPCDGPYVDNELLDRFVKTMQDKDALMCVASEDNHLHPTFALVDIKVKDLINKYLASGERKLGKFYKDNNAQEVDFTDKAKMFINLNSPEDFTANA